MPWRLRLEVCVWRPVLSCAGLSGTVGRGGSSHHTRGCRGGRQVWGLLERGRSREASEPASLSLYLYLCSAPLWTAFVQTLRPALTPILLCCGLETLSQPLPCRHSSTCRATCPPTLPPTKHTSQPSRSDYSGLYSIGICLVIAVMHGVVVFLKHKSTCFL